jgi:hypothetical protein
MNAEIKSMNGRGGICFGYFHITWPFAQITVHPDRITIDVPFAKAFSGLAGVFPHYEFERDGIVSACRVSAMFGYGIQIEHTYPDYPKRFVISASKTVAEEIQRLFQKT